MRRVQVQHQVHAGTSWLLAAVNPCLMCQHCILYVGVTVVCMAQDSFAARFKREVKQALVQVRPDAAGTAKGRHVGASSSASAPLNQAEGSAAHDDDYDQVLDDRLDWFHQVGRVTARWRWHWWYH